MEKRKRTEKSKYKHETTGDYCTCAAYVAEIMCIRNAENKNEGSLPYKFWNKKPWNWTFKRQLIAARKLLKKYDEAVLIQTINLPSCKRIFSLNNHRLISALKKQQKTLAKPKDDQALKPKNDATHRKKTYGKQSKISKLRSIDAKKNKD